MEPQKAHIHQTTKNHVGHSDSLTLGIQKSVMNVIMFSPVNDVHSSFIGSHCLYFKRLRCNVDNIKVCLNI